MNFKHQNNDRNNKSNEGDFTMNNKNCKHQKKTTKLGKAMQQNLIEMISYLYREPGRFTIDDMAHELNLSRRTVFRFITTVNDFAPIISSYIDKSNMARLKLNDSLSEKMFDYYFVNKQGAPILYVFLKALTKPVSVSEIQAELYMSEKQAIRVIENIAECSPYGDFTDYNF